MDETIINTTEEGIRYLEAHAPSGDVFQLAISDSFTFAGQPDIMGAGMAILLDKIEVLSPSLCRGMRHASGGLWH